MIYTHFLLVLILPFLLYESTTEAKCSKLLGALANGQMTFVDCMVKYSSPANSCGKCFEQHKNMTNCFEKLVADVNCSKILNENRLGIVYNIQKDLVGFWNKGFCDDCYGNDGIISYETDQFQNMTDDFTKCVNNHNIAEICGNCSQFYGKLNDFYTKMDAEKKGQICFDTQDKMNRTRSLWSKDLNCCHREYNFTFFFLASTMFGALPIIFYFGMYGYTKRMERNHEVLDADLNTGHASTSTGLQSATSHIEERINRTDNSSDEDDNNKLKKQSKQNSSHPENVKTQKETTKPTSSERPSSSNEIGTLIDL